MWPDSVNALFTWKWNEDGVGYVSPSVYKFEWTEDGDLYENTDDAGWYGTRREAVRFNCDVERFTWNTKNNGEELGSVDAGDVEVDASEYADVEDERWEEGEKSNVDCEEDGGDDEKGEGCEGEGKDDEEE